MPEFLLGYKPLPHIASRMADAGEKVPEVEIKVMASSHEHAIEVGDGRRPADYEMVWVEKL